jgi:hypothetical protein
MRSLSATGQVLCHPAGAIGLLETRHAGANGRHSRVHRSASLVDLPLAQHIEESRIEGRLIANPNAAHLRAVGVNLDLIGYILLRLGPRILGRFRIRPFLFILAPGQLVAGADGLALLNGQHFPRSVLKLCKVEIAVVALQRCFAHVGEIPIYFLNRRMDAIFRSFLLRLPYSVTHCCVSLPVCAGAIACNALFTSASAARSPL